MMSPATLALARTLLVRLRKVEASLLDEAVDAEGDEEKAREEIVRAVLFSEAGVTNPQEVRRVARALPPVVLEVPLSEEDVRRVAEVIEARSEVATRPGRTV